MRAVIISAALLAASGSFAQTLRFDTDAPGSAPAGWTCGATGGGNPRWTVERDSGAPSPPEVLLQSGVAAFPWCVRADAAITDGFVEVKLKPIKGRSDQAGGVVWRWKDGNNYYVARANALENNVALYYVQDGTRKTLKYVDAPVAGQAWHTLRVEFTGTRIVVLFDSKPTIEFEDAHVSGPGAVGVWTKADSVTSFDDFAFGSAKKP